MPRTERKLSLSELRVGIFVLAALILFAFLILNSTGDFNPFEKKLYLKARFLSADGLRPAADVQLAGVSIGKVTDVKFLPPDDEDENRIEATLAVGSTLEGKPITELIREDSSARLIATSVLGNEKMINISPGSSSAAAVREGSILRSSSAISMNQLTETGNDLLEQIKKLAVPANEILKKANKGDGTLGRIVNDESLYQNLDGAVAEAKATMQRLQATIDKINSGQGSAGKLVNDPELYNSLTRTVTHLESISADIKSGRGSAGKFVSDDALYNETRAAVADLRRAVGQFNEIAADFKAVSTDLREGRGTAGKLLKDEKMYDDARDALTRFSSATAKLDAILADAREGRGTLGKILTDETLYNSINQTANNVATFTGEGTKLLNDFRQNPKKFLRIKLAIF
ncbi:MAG: MCE family protein [Acidobacteria bacterium]|nr:MCE family protein [Acidobacteriota bacterium]MCW5950602.1 MCE family protein [Pyrinomonadaceae bacterium]